MSTSPEVEVGTEERMGRDGDSEWFGHDCVH